MGMVLWDRYAASKHSGKQGYVTVLTCVMGYIVLTPPLEWCSGCSTCAFVCGVFLGQSPCKKNYQKAIVNKVAKYLDRPVWRLAGYLCNTPFSNSSHQSPHECSLCEHDLRPERYGPMLHDLSSEVWSAWQGLMLQMAMKCSLYFRVYSLYWQDKRAGGVGIFLYFFTSHCFVFCCLYTSSDIGVAS